MTILPSGDALPARPVAGLLAKWLDEPKTRGVLVSGGKSRLKQILIRGEAGAPMEKLAARVASLQSGD